MLTYTLKQLRYVEAAGRMGSISKAATEMAISQSSITAAIDALEAALGYELFVRTPAKGIRPTTHGADALALIRRFHQSARHLEADLQSVTGMATGTLRIACYATAAPAFLPTILRSVTERLPAISITVLEGSMSRIMENLNEGDADLTFTYENYIDQRHHFDPLFTAPPYAVVPLDFPSANGETTLAELAAQPMVMLDLPFAREYYRDLFQDAGLAINIAHSTRSSEILRALVAGGFGVSLLNILPLDYREGESGYRILRIRDGGAAPTFGIVTMAGVEQPKVVQAFIANCIELRQTGAFDGLTVN